jgi:FkbM family methyltransferase
MKQWALENGHKFACILTTDTEILNKYQDTAIEFMASDIDDLAKKTKDFIYFIIQENNIEESIFWSQEGEDRWIAENMVLPDKGIFLDIGTCYPKILSNTYYFEHTLGWQGLCIEPDPMYFEWARKGRKCYMEQVAISPSVGNIWFQPHNKVLKAKTEDSIEVKCARLDDLLNKYKITSVDLISMDIEGYEKEAWSTFDYTKYNPKIIIIEHTENGTFNREFADQLLQDSNYYIAHTTPLNFILANKNGTK